MPREGVSFIIRKLFWEVLDVSQAYAADHGIAEFIGRRWSPRAFLEEARITREQMMPLLEAARWAPSAYNEQPWRFLVALKEGDGQAFEGMLSCLAEANREWAWRASAWTWPVLAARISGTICHRADRPTRV